MTTQGTSGDGEAPHPIAADKTRDAVRAWVEGLREGEPAAAAELLTAEARTGGDPVLFLDAADAHREAGVRRRSRSDIETSIERARTGLDILHFMRDPRCDPDRKTLDSDRIAEEVRRAEDSIAAAQRVIARMDRTAVQSPPSDASPSSGTIQEPHGRKQEKRDWFLYHSYRACVSESDMNKCATYASLAIELDPDDVSANQLYAIARRRGGVNTLPPRGSKLGPLHRRHRIGVGAVLLLLPSAHRGYVILPEYILSRSLGAGKRQRSLELGFGVPLGELDIRPSVSSGSEPPAAAPAPAAPAARIRQFASGARVRFQFGFQRQLNGYSLLRLHVDVAAGLMATLLSGGNTNIFFHLMPEIGLDYHLGRTAIGVSGAGSWLADGSKTNVRQGFGLGVQPHLSIGF